MKAVYTKVDPCQDVIREPIYMTRQQYEQAVYIPDRVRSRIIIVEFIEVEE